MIEIYTDGSCLKNPGGPGAWAAILIENEKETIVCDGEKITTNNRMELRAVIEGLKIVKEESCRIYSDSRLTINCATGKWNRKANLDLWKDYDSVSSGKNIEFVWVKGHSGNEYNEKVDQLAYQKAKQMLTDSS